MSWNVGRVGVGGVLVGTVTGGVTGEATGASTGGATGATGRATGELTGVGADSVRLISMPEILGLSIWGTLFVRRIDTAPSTTA